MKRRLLFPLMNDLPPNFSSGMLDGMDVHIGVASFHFANQFAERSSLQRTDEVPSCDYALHHPSPNGNSKPARAEQKDDDGAVHPSSAEMDMALRHVADIAD